MDEGKELFVQYGNYGFSMRDLAKKLEMSQGNIYNYFSSKRELWFAIQQQELNFLKQQFELITQDQKLSYNQRIYKILEQYLEISLTNYSRINFMFQDTPPESIKEPGVYEQNYNIRSPVLFVRDFIQEGVDKGELQVKNVDEFTYLYYALAYGVSEVSHKMNDIDLGSISEIPKETFHVYALKVLKKYLDI